MAVRDLLPFRAHRGLRRWEEPFRSFFEEVEDLFERFFGDYEVEPATERWSILSPKVDMVESDKDYKLTAELPGIEEKDLEVTLDDDNVLTIKGEKKEEKEDRDKNYYYRERRFGSFVRRIPLPEDIDADKIEAKFKNGVLTLHIPKVASAKKGKKIEIKS
ncbi:MAG: Hsp20/alpha crystallin family protein [Nitrospirae bacterium]|nr:MAG: Hsp20/alpha crystallin family protein [Nitrospirota bacterium]